MNMEKVEFGGTTVAVVSGDGILIQDVQSALDLIASVSYETGCDRLVIDKANIHERFFDLKTRLAGEILQKFVNYKVKAAIVGDFEALADASRSFKDFMYECNNGRDIFFVPAKRQAFEKLSKST